MDITLIKGDAARTDADAVALLWTSEGGKFPSVAVLDKALDGWLSAVAAEEGFKAKAGEILTVRTDGRLPAKKIILCGVGAKKNADGEALRQAAAAALSAVKKQPAAKLAIAFDIPTEVGAFEAGKVIAEGLVLGAYRFGTFKALDAEGPASVQVLVDVKSHKAAKEGFDLGRLFAQATVAARELVNQPGGHLLPLELAKAAEAAVKDKANVTIQIIHKAELKKMGAGGLLGISQGSDHDPVLVHMVYKPRKAKKVLAIVGKAITFDSGGLSIKPSKGMETMKCDMAGAAAVIGVFSVIDQIKPEVEVHGIFGACENMISGKALRPGDVVKTLNGKTIEILNTDAEGRVTLADTLHYAALQKPDAIVDLATLTGAVVVALGDEITGLMSNNRSLSGKIKAAAEEAGEKMWELPLEKNYAFELKSDVADYKNDTSRAGMSITAGLLLQEFVGGLPWVHLDIAGPAFADKAFNSYTKKGGTGHAVRTLLSWLRGY